VAGRLDRKPRPRMDPLGDPLDELADLARVDLEAEKVELIDRAREEGATWLAISRALGYDDRRYAQRWRSRHGTQR